VSSILIGIGLFCGLHPLFVDERPYPTRRGEVKLESAAEPGPRVESSIIQTAPDPPGKRRPEGSHTASAAIPTDRIAGKLGEIRSKLNPYDEPDRAQQFYLLKRLPPGEQKLPVEKYFAAQDLMRTMPLYSTAKTAFMTGNEHRIREDEREQAGAWDQLGPGNIGGRTRALVIHPSNPQIMYAAGVSGGVWKTTNNGANWTPLTDMLSNLAVCSLVMDPKNPEVIYAGTGEGFFNIDGVRGAGIFRTADGGQHWIRLASTSGEDFHYVNDLVISPHDSQRIYAATRTGVWRSVDGGAAWSRILIAEEDEIGGCLDLVIRTDQPTDHLFASFTLFPDYARRAGIYLNTDAGGSGEWVKVLTGYGMGRTSMAIAPSNQNVIYAVSWGYVEGQPLQTGLHGVFRSTSGGAPDSWTSLVGGDDPVKLNRLLLANTIIATLSECGLGRSDIYTQGWYNNVIAVDPADADRVWVGGTDLFRSDDGGRTWGMASHWWPEKNVPQYAHADHHVIAFHPQYDGATNKMMFVGTDGGIFRTDDARAPVATGERAPCNPAAGGVRWTALNTDYGVTQFYHGLPFPDGSSYFGGTQDNGTIRGTDAGGVNDWREIYGGDGGYVAIDPTNPNILYAENTGLSMKKSTDGGRTFTDLPLGFGGDSLFITPFAMDPSNPRRLWTGAIAIVRTEDGGATWEQVGDSIGTNSGFVSAIAVSPTDSSHVLIGKTTGLVHRKYDALFLINPFSPPVPNRDRYQWAYFSLPGYVSGLAIDPYNKYIAYATVSTFGVKHVWRSVDGGVSWHSIDGDGPRALPDVPVHCIVVDPSNTSRLYVGTDLGVFVSPDGGASWAVEYSGFANTVVESLAINTANGISSLYAFTHGRGAYRVTLGPGCNQPTFDPTASFEAPGGEGRLQINSPPDGCPWQAQSNADWITVVSGSGQGGGEVRYSVAANTGFERRVGTVTVGGRNFSVTQEAGIDTEPPFVAFTGPVTSGGTYTTNSGYVDLAWTVRENYNISLVRVDRNDTIANLPVYGPKLPENQTMNGTYLSTGVNTFTVTVRDWAGNTSTDSIRVIFQPEYLITSIAGIYFRQGFEGDGGPALEAFLSTPQSATLDAAGNLFIADTNNGRIRRVDAQTGVITTVAGRGYPDGVFSLGDGGPALEAVIAVPIDVKVDRAGAIYISERSRIRKVTPDGRIDTLAGTGDPGYSGDGGPAKEAKISYVTFLAIDPDGNLLIADRDNHRIRKIDQATGIITTIAGDGTPGSAGDGGPAVAARLTSPYAIAIDAAGDLYFTDGARIRRVASSSGIISTVAGNGALDPIEDNVPALSSPIGVPSGLAIDSAGRIFFSSFGLIRRIGADGRVRTIAGRPNYGGQEDNIPAIQSQVGSPLLEIDGAGDIIFADSASSRIRKLFPLRLANGAPVVTIDSPSSTGSFTTTERVISMSGTASSNGTVARVWFHSDRGFRWTVSGTNNWRITDLPLKPGLNRITITAEDPVGTSGSAVINITYNPDLVIRRIAGDRLGRFGPAVDGGPATLAMLRSPRDVAIDTAGHVYIADTYNNRIRKVSPDGLITTFAGTGQLGSGSDGIQATRSDLSLPDSVACDAVGNVYIADTGNHRIRRVAPNGIMTTIAGTGIDDFRGDGGPATAARLSRPRGLTFDDIGNLLVADSGNNRIRRIDMRTGIITTVAGSGTKGFGGDGGPALEASLDLPVDVAVDRGGNLFIVDRANKRIRKVDTQGIMTTFVIDELGFGKEGDFYSPLITFNGITSDPEGNLYVSSQANNQIRKFAPDGSSTMYAGLELSITGYYSTGDGGGATGHSIGSPSGLAFGRAGSLFVVDTSANSVMMISPYRSVETISSASYLGPEVGTESIVSAFGTNLATGTQSASSVPLPITLAGTTVRVRDNEGIERNAPLFFVSPFQINYQIPPGSALGPALVTITNSSGEVHTGLVQIAGSAPGLFSANATGAGLAAGVVLRIGSGGAQNYEPIAQFDAAQNRFKSVPIDLSDPTDQVFLLLFGTGVRNRNPQAAVSVMTGGTEAEVLYAGPQSDFVGLDQINIRLPRTLAGRGDVEVNLRINDRTSNNVLINIK